MFAYYMPSSEPPSIGWAQTLGRDKLVDKARDAANAAEGRDRKARGGWRGDGSPRVVLADSRAWGLSHMHPDHLSGLTVLHERFPNAPMYAFAEVTEYVNARETAARRGRPIARDGGHDRATSRSSGHHEAAQAIRHPVLNLEDHGDLAAVFAWHAELRPTAEQGAGRPLENAVRAAATRTHPPAEARAASRAPVP